MQKPLPILACWIFAVAAVVILWFFAVRPADDDKLELNVSQTVVLGSSRSRHAFPSSGNTMPGLMGDGRGHTRLCLNGVTSYELEELLNYAIESRVKTVILEISPFVYSFRYKEKEQVCNVLCETVSAEVASIRANFRNKARRAFGMGNTSIRSRLAQTREEPNLDSEYDSATDLGKLYPVVFRRVEHGIRLTRLIKMAREQGTEVILFLPPQSATATAYMGGAQTSEIKTRTSAMAQGLGLPLFMPWKGFRDAHFVDHMHLSRLGRAKLQADWRAWSAASE